MKKITGPNPLSDAQPGRREVRSFVLREGRLTKAQARALETLWPRYGIENDDGPIELEQAFGHLAPVHVEVGFGDGTALIHAAQGAPEDHFIGIEVHRPGVGALLIRLEELGLRNVRIVCADATRVLEDRLGDGSLASVRVFFPDPWPKKRHHKRRIIQPPFVATVRRKLAPGGWLHLATDWGPYAEHMQAVVDGDGGFIPAGATGPRVDRPQWRPQTRFERRGLRLGHEVWDLLYRSAEAERSERGGTWKAT